MSSTLELAVIGNSTISALLDQEARIVWGCFPRFDADPTFCALLDEDGAGGSGFYEVSLFGLARTEQRYRRNSAIVITTLHDDDGNAVEITDFAPRFKQFGRVFRPTMLVRHVRPIAGTPRIRIRLRPAFEHGAGRPEGPGRRAPPCPATVRPSGPGETVGETLSFPETWCGPVPASSREGN